MKAVDLLPGDILIHHYGPQSLFEKLMTGAELWGEWAGISGDDLQANHCEFAYMDVKIAGNSTSGFTVTAEKLVFCQNPPKARSYSQADIPWDHIGAVLRLDLNTIGGPADAGRDSPFIQYLSDEARIHTGDPYDWKTIYRFGWIGLTARVWPWLAQQFLKQRDDALEGHAKVCSTMTADCIEAAVIKAYPRLAGFDLFDGKIEEPRPADFQMSRYLRKVA